MSALGDYLTIEMPCPRAFRLVAVAILAASAIASSGCRRPATREWGPDDHDVENPSSTQQQARPAGTASPQDETRALVETAWNSNCATCHGRMGQGDGPQGPMVKASNLTDPALLDKRTDAELAAVIRAGRNRMPAFASLPDSVVTGLVARIRALRAE